jgi:cysteine synthase
MTEIIEIKSPSSIRSWGRGRVYDSIIDTVGHTPLVRLSRIMAEVKSKAEILMKLEFFNPLSSVKDRIGVAMIDALEEQQGIAPGKTVLIEPTSGNTGIGLAFVAAVRGYRLILVMPESNSLERRKILAHLGAELVLTPATGGMPEAVSRAEELAKSIPNAVIPGQFDNPANPLVHQRTTAEEIWADTAGEVDALVIGVGTGGTLTGCARALKPRKPSLKIIAVEPTTSAVLSGKPAGPHKIQGLGAGFVPSILETEYIDEVITVSSETALEVSRKLARVEGIAGGISTGGNLAATLRVAARPEMAGKTIVTFAPSSAERYFSSALFVEEQSSRVRAA